MRLGLGIGLGMGVMGVASGGGVTPATPTVPAIPASARGAWLASAVTATAMTDLTGNGRDLVFGATAPTTGVDPENGVAYLNFAKGVTSPIVCNNFYAGVSATNDFCTILVCGWIDRNIAADSYGIVVSSGASPTDTGRLKRAIRMPSAGRFRGTQSGMTVTGGRDFVDFQPISDTIKPFDLPSDPTIKTRFLLSQESISGPSYRTQTLRVIDDYPYYGRSGLTTALTCQPQSTSTGTPEIVDPFAINLGQSGMRVYGAIVLDAPSQADIDDAIAWAGYHAFMGPQRRTAIIYDGDSVTVDVLSSTYLSSSIGWRENIHCEGSFAPTTKVVSQHMANGGRDAYDATSVGALNYVDQQQRIHDWVRVWTLMADKVIAALLIGTNDINKVSYAQADTIASIEAWASIAAAAGAHPIWLGAAWSHSAKPEYEALSKAVRDRDNAFEYTLNSLQSDPIWGWQYGVSTGLSNMNLQGYGGVHLSSAGNADVAWKIGAEIAGHLGTTVPHLLTATVAHDATGALATIAPPTGHSWVSQTANLRAWPFDRLSTGNVAIDASGNLTITNFAPTMATILASTPTQAKLSPGQDWPVIVHGLKTASGADVLLRLNIHRA